MSIEGKLVNELTTTSPAITDTTLSSEVGNPTILKRTTWQVIYNLFKGLLDTEYDSVYVKLTGPQTIAGEKTFSSSPIVPTPTTDLQASNKEYTDIGDNLFRYSIVRTVTSGNLTVSLRNYEGNNPTATKPVKIMIGGVLRTISNTLSITANAGTNYLNLGGTVLATQETDVFVFLQWNTNTSSVNLLVSRLPSSITMSNFSSSNTNEKGVIGIINYNTTDSVLNIGRFNATLSAGAGFTWSVPSTSIIIHEPIYETRFLIPTVSPVYNGTAPSGTVISRYRYQISYNKCFISYHQEFTVSASGNSVVTGSLPINAETTFLADGLHGHLNIGTGAGYGSSNSATVQCRGGTFRLSGTSMNCNTFVVSGFYFI